MLGRLPVFANMAKFDELLRSIAKPLKVDIWRPLFPDGLFGSASKAKLADEVVAQPQQSEHMTNGTIVGAAIESLAPISLFERQDQEYRRIAQHLCGGT
jgi:hypothetical protein